jgi:guanylate kinase
MSGNLLIIAAPSGAGKTSLVRELIAADARLGLSISHTTRAPRPGEQDGVDYHFVDVPAFERLIASDALLEWANVHGNFYGTGRERVLSELAADRDVILEIDYQGARQVRQRFPDVCSIFILPPSRGTLLTRLRNRGQDSDAVIAKRMAAARTEMSFMQEFEYILINDRFDLALAELKTIVAAARLTTRVQCARHAPLITKLLDDA